VITKPTNMAIAAAALETRSAAPGVSPEALSRLRILQAIPPRHGVLVAEHDSAIIRSGEVVVYDELALNHEGLVENGIYVVQYQHPAACMPWDMWWSAPGVTRSRLNISNSIVIARPCRRVADHWWTHPLQAKQRGFFLMSDGPQPEWYLADKIVGRVVGIYNPAAIATGEAA
jgi:hypothetical protein